MSKSEMTSTPLHEPPDCQARTDCGTAQPALANMIGDHMEIFAGTNCLTVITSRYSLDGSDSCDTSLSVNDANGFWHLTRVRSYVAAHIDGEIRVSDLAGICGVSVGYFCRVFRARVGCSPHAYVVSERIRHAQRMMVETEDRISDIAYACGLTDQAHLTRWFKRLVGETPLAWRRRQSNLRL